MELRQLKYFIKTAETLNFSEAAKILCINQSTLSQQIRQLEEEMKTSLFQRNSHNVILTEAGEELLPLALKTLYTSETCLERMNDQQQLLTGTLKIGVTFTFSPILTETLLEFIRKYPQIKLIIHYKPMEELMNMLERHEVDFVLAFKSTKRYQNVESHVLFNNRLAAIVNEYHPLAQKKKVTLTEIEKYEIALPTLGLQARNVFDIATSHYCPHLKIRLELNEVNILLRIVKRSKMITMLSEATIYNEKGLKAIPLDVPENNMDGCIHMLKDVYLKHSIQLFIHLLSESKIIKEHIRSWFN